jgi:hypothetical protein
MNLLLRQIELYYDRMDLLFLLQLQIELYYGRMDLLLRQIELYYGRMHRIIPEFTEYPTNSQANPCKIPNQS